MLRCDEIIDVNDLFWEEIRGELIASNVRTHLGAKEVIRNFINANDDKDQRCLEEKISVKNVSSLRNGGNQCGRKISDLSSCPLLSLDRRKSNLFKTDTLSSIKRRVLSKPRSISLQETSLSSEFNANMKTLRSSSCGDAGFFIPTIENGTQNHKQSASLNKLDELLSSISGGVSSKLTRKMRRSSMSVPRDMKNFSFPSMEENALPMSYLDLLSKDELSEYCERRSEMTRGQRNIRKWKEGLSSFLQGVAPMIGKESQDGCTFSKRSIAASYQDLNTKRQFEEDIINIGVDKTTESPQVRIYQRQYRNMDSFSKSMQKASVIKVTKGSESNSNFDFPKSLIAGHSELNRSPSDEFDQRSVNENFPIEHQFNFSRVKSKKELQRVQIGVDGKFSCETLYYDPW